jgi:hypothetical protein
MKNFTRFTMLFMALFATASMMLAQNAATGLQTKAQFLGLEQSVQDYSLISIDDKANREELLSEGFDFDFPPAGWVIEVTHPTNNWNQTNPDNPDLDFNNVDPTSLFSAMAMWDANAASDEWIITPEINATESPVMLEFYFGISGPWLTNATLKLHVTTDGGDTWTELMDVADEVDPAADWAWYQVEMDLTDYADGPFHVAWQYVGQDGDLCGLDGVSISAGGDFLYIDDFESYDLGAGIAASSDWWILWPATGVTDVLISDDFANSPTQALKVGTGAVDDVVLLMGNKTSGVYGLDFYIYVPEGEYSGYYNIQHFESPGLEWASEVYFANNGDGWIHAGMQNAAFFTYPKGEWVLISQTFDLDEDWTELYVGGELVHGWQFSYQANSFSGTKMLGGLNLYPAPQAGTTSLYYVDDVSFYVLQQGSLDPTIDMNTSNAIVQMQEGNIQTVTRTITNVGESLLEYDIVRTFNEPTMQKTTALVPAGSNGKGQGTFELAPSTISGDPAPATRDVILNYDGENNDAIGINGGGQYRVAARFPADMVAQYNGMYLEQVMVYINDMPIQTKVQIYGMGNLMIPGPGELLLEQEFTPVTTSWNTITLDEPIYIDGQDIWIGYWIDEPEGDFWTAGVDAGPPIPDGRWISTGPGWSMLPDNNPNLLVNWNIRGLLTGEAGAVWLSADPSEGALEAQESDEVVITIDATELAPLNVYRGKLHIRSNDPVNDHLVMNVWVTVLVGLNEVGEQAYVSTYPNPAADMITVKANTEIIRVSVSNMLGQVVYHAELNTEQTVVDLSAYETGMYFVKVETLNGTTTHKVMVK